MKILRIYETSLDAHIGYVEHLNNLIEHEAGGIYDYAAFPEHRMISVLYIPGVDDEEEYAIAHKSVDEVTLNTIEMTDTINYEGEISKQVALLMIKEKGNEQEGF